MESYGTNPTQKKDDMYGVHGTGGGYDARGVTGDQVTTGVGHGTTGGHVTGGGYGATGQEQMMRPEKEEHDGGILHRSGSSGSSSSEDDGMGGRRKKKGLKEKIKEKLPGGDKTDEHVQEHGTTTATGGYGTAATTTAGREEPEKKAMMEKIKEKLPGHH